MRADFKESFVKDLKGLKDKSKIGLVLIIILILLLIGAVPAGRIA